MSAHTGNTMLMIERLVLYIGSVSAAWITSNGGPIIHVFLLFVYLLFLVSYLMIGLISAVLSNK